MIGSQKEYQALIEHAEDLETIAATVHQVQTKDKLEALSGSLKDLARGMEVSNG